MPPELADAVELIDPQAGDDTPEPDKPADKPADKDKDKDPILAELRDLRRDVKSEREARRHAEKTAQYWAERAAAGPAAKKEEPAEEPKTTVDLVEALTNGDHKAVKQAMRELGLVTMDEVRSLVTHARQEGRQEDRLLSQYPDLADERSEFFKLTAEIYNDLARDPHMAKSPRLSEVAAEMADRRLNGGRAEDRDGARRRQPAREPDDDDEDLDDERERDRVERVRRQTGGRSAAAPRRSDTAEDSDELDAMQKTIVAKLRQAGADISEDGYRKRAKAGVRMSGLPTRRPRR